MIHGHLSKCKSVKLEGIAWSAPWNIFKNHGLRLILAQRKITLDNSWADTYHTRACPKGLTSHAENFHGGNRVNRGAYFHDE
jgi:hypothetical protein